MFRLNTNIDKKERSVVSMRDFKGLDTVHSPMNISYQHAIDMRNLINRNGVNRKRKGWRQEYAFDKTATPAGTWSGKLDFSENADGTDIQEVVIHFSYTNSNLLINAYKISDGVVVTIGRNFNITNLSFNQIRVLCFDNKLYIAGAGKLLIARTYRGGITYGLSIMDIDYLIDNYPDEFVIPTTILLGATTVSLPSNGALEPGPAVFLPFVGSWFNTDDYYLPNEEYPEGEDPSSTRLDNISPLSSKLTGSTVTSEASKILQDINILHDDVQNLAKITLTEDDLSIDTEGHYQVRIKCFRINQMEGYNNKYWNGIDEIPDDERAYITKRNNYYSNIIVDVFVNGYKTATLDGFTSYYEQGVSVFYHYNSEFGVAFNGKNFCVYINNLVDYAKNNILNAADFEFYIRFKNRDSQSSEVLRKKVNGSNMLTLFGAEGNPNRLFLCDGSNTILYSEYRNPLYIGSQNTIVLGSTPITGWIKGTETSLYVFKQYSRQEESLYVIDGELVTSEENQYGVDEGEVVFRNKGYALPESAVNQDAVCSLANDVLVVSDDGVYGITLSANVASTERFARSRAEQIKNLLQEQDLTKAKCIVWDNKMFLVVGSLVFVADARFRATFDGDMADTFNYEWWLWDNIPVKYWVIVQDKLCFVTDDNRLCAFYDGFSDYVYDDLRVAVVEDDGVTISKQYAEYNKIALNAAYRACIDAADITGIEDGALIIQTEKLYTALNEGDTVFFDVTAGTISGYPVAVSTLYTVESIDIMSGRVTFVTAEGTAVAFTAAMGSLLAANPLRISKAATQEYDMTIDAEDPWNNTRITDADGNLVQLIVYNGVASYSATIYKKLPVKAYWKTGSYDFGSSLYAKTIERFSVAFDRESPKKMKLYYTTAWNGGDRLFKDLRKNTDFDFDAFSFLLFTFDQRFETSYTRRLLIRNFNFISFLLLSDDAEDFSVDSLSFVYKVNKLNRGEH